MVFSARLTSAKGLGLVEDRPKRIFPFFFHTVFLPTSEATIALVDDTKSDWASTRTQPDTDIQKVIIITGFKRELITSETADPPKTTQPT
ncbi:MAG TPA: hypothetical protein VJ249_02295 [Candidatus Bathyarchaeia archaeon]|nr:hypothetical protein [Candidatus Bathyarchaeia archaeon]